MAGPRSGPRNLRDAHRVERVPSAGRQRVATRDPLQVQALADADEETLTADAVLARTETAADVLNRTATQITAYRVALAARERLAVTTGAQAVNATESVVGALAIAALADRAEGLAYARRELETNKDTQQTTLLA